MEPIEKMVYNQVIEDLIKTPPQMIISHKPSRLQAMGNLQFDFIAYFSMDDRFKSLMESYEHMANIDDYIIYRLSDNKNLSHLDASEIKPAL